MFTDEIRIALGRALETARGRRHAFLTLEHLLYGLLHEPRASEILEACGANLGHLEAQLLEAFDDAETVTGSDAVEPEQTLAFSRAVERALRHVQAQGKDAADGGDVLVAMFSESGSHAVSLLQAQGIERLHVVKYISHGIRRTPADTAVPSFAGDETEGSTGGSPLSQFTVDLVEKAAEGGVDPLIGRTAELERAIHVLARRRKSNPLFIGDSGVGKTAIVEGLAKAIHEGQVPPLLAEVRIYALDMGGLMAGTRFRGDFEDRLKGVIDAIEGDEHAVLFIDEIHMLVGAGATSGGSMDASNLLKPALASGALRCIGSTTHEDYRTSFGKDKALARRFQKIDVEEPSVTDAIDILRGLKSRYEDHHALVYSDEAIVASAELAARHITDLQLPDKAIDVLDEVGASAQLGGRASVEVEDVERAVARIARVPEKQVSTEDRDKLRDLEGDLKRVIYGQDQAVAEVVASIKMARAGIGSARRPLGSFLFAGPTGVGKTELARQLALHLGIELHRFDMSEYMEKHSVSRLIGAPPGYVGYDRGGLLTDAVHKTPHSVVVLDEIEKAHGDIFNILLQVMDNATLTDSSGRKTDFRNVVLIMTTNAGAREQAKRGIGFEGMSGSSRADSVLRDFFPPEFRNRLDAVVAFDALPEHVILRVVDKFLLELEHQLTDRDVTLSASDAARSFFLDKGYKPEFGAREMGRVIQEHVKKKLADEILFGALRQGGHAKIDAVDGEVVLEIEPRKPAAPDEPPKDLAVEDSG